jgi:DNA-binding beta-propeller fold protein YncE
MDLLREKFSDVTYARLMDPDKPGRVGLLALTVPAEVSAVVEGYQQGLLARYYRGLDWNGPVLYEMVDPLIAVHRQLQLPAFSVWWQGTINAPDSGTYVFETLSDDGSYVYIDGQLVVDNGGVHGSRPVSGSVSLQAGPHDIDIKYFQDGGGITMEVFWQPPRGPKEFLPARVLFPPGTVDVASLPPVTLPPVEEQEATPTPAEQPPVAIATPLPVETPVGELGVGQFILQWGSQGSGAGQFEEPVDVAIDGEGNVYVADLGNKRVQKFDANGRFLAMWEGGDEPFEEPLAVATGPGGEIWVLDSYTNWVQRFDQEGKWQGKVGGPESGFFHARELMVDEEGVLYVADTGTSRIVKYSKEGLKIGEIGPQGRGPGELYGPVGLAIDEEGLLYEADVDNRRLQVLEKDGRYVRAWGIPESHTAEGNHVAVSGKWVYVTDLPRHRVLVYEKDGKLIGGWGREGGGEGEFRRPMGIGIGPDGSVYVADSQNNRIQKFAPWSE